MQQDSQVAPVKLAGESPSSIQQSAQSVQGLDSSNTKNIDPSQQVSTKTVGQPSSDINPPQQVEQAKGDMFNPPPQKKKKSMFLPCCIGIILFFLLAIGGIAAFAYFTDTEIPIVSDIIEQISNLIKDPKEEAEKATEQVASTLVSAFLPLVSDDSGLASAFATSSVSRDYMENYLNSYEEIESLRFELDGTISSENSQNIESNFLLVGAIDFTDELSERFETNFDIDLASSGTEMYFTGELKGIDSDTYLKLDTYPFLFSSYLSSFESQWVKIEGEEVTETEGLIGIESEQEEITEDDIDKLMEFVTNDAVLKNAERLDDEDIEGNNCSCIQLSWTNEEFKDVLKAYAQIYETEYNEEEVNESLKDIEYIEMQTCIGDESKMVHRVSLKMTGNSESEGNNEIELNLKLWDYNEDMVIGVPGNSILFEDALEESLQNYYGDSEIYRDSDFGF